MLSEEQWTYFVDQFGKGHRYRYVEFRYQYSKYPWLFPSERKKGHQFNDAQAMPLKFTDPEEAVRGFNQVNAMIVGINGYIKRANDHAELRKEMGIAK